MKYLFARISTINIFIENMESALTRLDLKSKEPLHVTTVTREHRCKVFRTSVSPDRYNKTEILEYIKHLYLTEKGQENSQLICWQSNYFLHKQTKIFDNLIEILNDEVNACVNLKHGYKLSLSELWAAVYSKGQYAKLHGHGRYCQFSGVIYLQSEQGHPGLTFEDNFSLPCTQDTAYFFDSIYHHAVGASELDELRIILAFNFYLNLPK